jgi:hypothetical protein
MADTPPSHAANTSAAPGGSESTLPRVDRADQAAPRRRNLRRSSMTGRVTGMRRGSVASQISQASVSTSDTPQQRRGTRRNSMLSTASRDSARSKASCNIDRLAMEIKDLQECRELELARAEEEKRHLRLQRQQSFESAEKLEGLLETASMADGGFVEAALRSQQHWNSDGTPSVGDFSVPADVVFEDVLRGEDTGKMSAATLDATDHLVSYEDPLKDEDLTACKTTHSTANTRRGRRRNRTQSSAASDEDRSVCSVESFDYAEKRIERIQQMRRSRSMSVDHAGAEGKRKPRRGRRRTRSTSREPGSKSAGTSPDGGPRRIRSRSLDVGGGYWPRRKQPSNSKSMRKPEAVAIANLRRKIQERKDDIQQTQNRMDIRIESAEENATMMEEIASMQIKTIADLKVEILKAKAAMRFNAARRHDSDAIAAERKRDPEYAQALRETEKSRQHLADLRGRIDEIVQQENLSNARQAELLRQIPKIRAEGAVADMKRMMEYNSTMDKVQKEDFASRIAWIKSRISKYNSNHVSKALVEGKYGTIDSTENPDELKKTIDSAHNEIQKMGEALMTDIDSIKSLPEFKSSPRIVQHSADGTLFAEGATATIERLGAEWAEQYVYLRMIRGRDEEIQSHEEHISHLNEEIVRMRNLVSTKKKEGKVERKSQEIQRISVGESGDAKVTGVSA